jgi:hypothetical protein
LINSILVNSIRYRKSLSGVSSSKFRPMTTITEQARMTQCKNRVVPTEKESLRSISMANIYVCKDTVHFDRSQSHQIFTVRERYI